MGTRTIQRGSGTKGAVLFPLLGGIAAFMLANSAYLLGVEIRQRLGHSYEETSTFQYVFASHLVVGIAFALVIVAFLAMHVSRLSSHRNDTAKQRGRLLAASTLVLVASGMLLVRTPGFPDFSAGFMRSVAYALHVALPVIMVLAFMWHRRAASNPLRRSARFAAATLSIVGVILTAWVITASPDPARVDGTANLQTFAPSLLKVTASGVSDPSELMRDDYCQGCHADVHSRWQASAHRNSSFNNPFYAASVQQTRERMMERDGDVSAARFCAGCHDPIPLATGEFDREEFGVANFPSASAGITCTVCHSVVSVDSPRGNADITIAPPVHYPFAFSESRALRWLSKLLLESNPEFHKRTFLKPLHVTAEFCGACHKVHIPESLNAYRWLRGQNHYDSFLQSGVSGHKIDSFYYPDEANTNCNACHMPAFVSNDRGATAIEPGGPTMTSDHLFAAGNTGLPYVLQPDRGQVIEAHRNFLKDTVTLDIVGFRERGVVDGDFIPASEFADRATAGSEYLAELVIRTRRVGHAFTQGTTDSNQVWVELAVSNDGEIVESSGVLDATGILDEMNTHTVRNYVVDSNGQRIARRNVEDIHTAVFRRQIPPGTADVAHYRVRVPDEGLQGLRISARLLYRKFDSEFRKFSLPAAGAENDLPIIAIAETEYTADNAGSRAAKPGGDDSEALNDYGIALYRKDNRAQFRQAEAIFRELDARNYAPARLNLVRLLLAEGRVDEATDLIESLDINSLDNPWTALWFTAQIDLQNGFVDETTNKLRQLIDNPPGRAIESGFDFSKDFVLLETLGNALIMQSRQYASDPERSGPMLAEARRTFERLLELEPERVSAHEALMRIALLENDEAAAEEHREAVAKYKPDEHAQSRAASLARERNSELDRLAGSIVIYDVTGTETR